MTSRNVCDICESVDYSEYGDQEQFIESDGIFCSIQHICVPCYKDLNELIKKLRLEKENT